MSAFGVTHDSSQSIKKHCFSYMYFTIARKLPFSSKLSQQNFVWKCQFWVSKFKIVLASTWSWILKQFWIVSRGSVFYRILLPANTIYVRCINISLRVKQPFITFTWFKHISLTKIKHFLKMKKKNISLIISVEGRPTQSVCRAERKFHKWNFHLI